MEGIKLKNNAELFDSIVHESPPEMGDLSITFKPRATAGGNGGVVIAFTSVIDGKPQRVQAVTTAANIINAAKVIGVWQGQGRN